jgi:heme oxygenase
VTALYAFERYHQMIECELHRLSELAINRQASHLIRCDLLTLTGNASNPLPPCPPLRLNRSTDAALGLMYVIEGSRQGGSIIARNLENTLALNAGYGAAFFTQDNPNLRSDWNQFVDRLNRQCSDSKACCLAAITTFERLECYLWSVHHALPETIELQDSA